MVRKREDGRWEGRIVVGHKKNGDPIHRYVLARTQKELIVKLHDCIEMYRDADLTEDSNMTLGEWLDRWINEYMIFTIRESTLDSYKAMIKNQIKPYLGDRPLSALTTQELQKFYNTVKKKGRVKPDKLHGTELADSMVRGIHMMLHEALDMAVAQRLIIKNPTVGTTIPKNNYPPKQILNDEQLDRFMKRIRQDERWYDFFYTELTTGLRLGEICGLMWSDFDPRKGTLSVNRTIHKEKGHFDNLTIGFCGDLKFGRTVHSLVAAMSRYTGIRFVFVSPEELKLPRYVKEQYVKSKNIPYTQSTSLEEVMPELDILYMTRVQKERFFNEEDYLRLKDSYILTPEKLENAKEDLRILHPLPRVNEISVAVDEDPRACYFKQAQNGRYIRMALIMKLLGIQ